MNAVHLLQKYFPPHTIGWRFVYEHSRAVADKALTIAEALAIPVDTRFLEEAALLHDVGICRVHAPDIGCIGQDPYIRHGILGREILESEGLPRHALVCERHIGVGLTTADIIRQGLPLPPRAMVPLTMEEKIVCFADLFYSKKQGKVHEEIPAARVREGLLKFGVEKGAIFDDWFREFIPGSANGNGT